MYLPTHPPTYPPPPPHHHHLPIPPPPTYPTPQLTSTYSYPPNYPLPYLTTPTYTPNYPSTTYIPNLSTHPPHLAPPAPKKLSAFSKHYNVVCWATFIFFSCLFWCSDFGKVRLGIRHDDSSCFRYSTGYVFYFVVAIFVTTIWRNNHFKSACCSFNHAIEVRVWRHFLLLVERDFCSFAWLNFWSHFAHLTHKNDFLTLKLTFIYINSKR